MTTYSTMGVIAQTTTAQFNAWVNEIYTGLVTQCGLTQTGDTGQMAVPCTTALPGTTNTVAGYYIFAFNDTLQSTSPIYLKIEFGTGSPATIPFTNLTVGAATNGAGTITGTNSGRATMCCSSGLSSTVTNYVSRYCYIPSQGILWMSFKQGANTNLPFVNYPSAAYMGFLIYRSVDNTGAPTADCVHLLVGNLGNPTNGNNQGLWWIYDYNTASAPVLGNTGGWVTHAIPGSQTTTLTGSTCQVFPVWQNKGISSFSAWGITNAAAMAFIAEFPFAYTAPIQIIGGVTMTYVGAGLMFAPAGNQLYGVDSLSGATYILLVPWQ